jgi:hypothetical protein
VLLPVIGVSQRADVVEVIGASLVAKAAGWGHRQMRGWWADRVLPARHHRPSVWPGRHPPALEVFVRQRAAPT